MHKSVHPFAAIGGTARARDLVRVVFEIELVVVAELQSEQMNQHD